MNNNVIFLTLTFNGEVTVTDVIAFCSLVMAVIGGIFTLLQWKESKRIKKADYVKELTEKMRTDPILVSTLNILDYGETWYNEKFHNGGDIEKNIDQTLGFFSYVCYLYSKVIISTDEFCLFKYKINRILRNIQVQDYLFNLYHFSKENNTNMSFISLLEYGRKNKILDKYFWDKSTCDKQDSPYHHYLNF